MRYPDLSRSIDFLLDKAGPVILYRLHTEILRDVSKAEAENLLEKVLLTPHYRRLLGYQKPNGYIGIGMHSWDKFKETPLQDGEAAARLISNYGIPRDLPLVKAFANALLDETVLEEEFSYYPPEVVRFSQRAAGRESGCSLQLLIDTCLALIGYGDGGAISDTQQISYDAFMSLLTMDSFEQATKFNVNSKKKSNYRYIEAGTYYPCLYHLQVLSHTHSWRSEDKKAALACALNRIHTLFPEAQRLHVKQGNKYYVPLWAVRQPLYPYAAGRHSTAYRRTLTDIVKLGIGKLVDVVNTSVVQLLSDMNRDGIVRPDFCSAYEKRRYKAGLAYPTPYSEVALEVDYASDVSLWCDLTFWAVQFLSLYNT